MPYKNDGANRQADSLHEKAKPGEIDRLHKMDRSAYDTPGSVKYCACVSCNTSRRIYDARGKTWQGLSRTKRQLTS